MEKFNAIVRQEMGGASDVKTPKQKLKLPDAPESGHNST
jgi:hypothetical protein